MRRAIVWDAALWKSRFFTLWGGQAFSLLGSQLVQFALVWWLTVQTGSGTVLAMATMAAVIPQVVLGPFAGALVDRWNRRRIMIVADSAIAAASIVLAALFALDVVRIWHVYVILFLRAIGAAFHWPAMRSSTTLMVPKEHYGRVAGLNQALQGTADIASPALGAVLLAVLPMQGILAIDAVTAATAVLPLLFIGIPNPRRSVQVAGSSFLQEMAEGFRFLLSWRGLLATAGIAAFLNFLLAPAGSLLPLLVTRRFHGEAFHLAGLQMATGIGVVAGGLLLTVWGGLRRRMATALMGVVALGASTLLLGLTPSTLFPVALLAMLGTGIALPIANGSIQAALQSSVPPDLQGRIFTLVTSVSAAMMPLGLAVAGPLSDAVGVETWFIVGGIAASAIGGLSLCLPSVLGLEERGAELGRMRASRREAGPGEAVGVPVPDSPEAGSGNA